MFEKLISGIRQHAAISDEGIREFVAALKLKQVKKKKNLLSEGDSGNYMYYLNEGLFRYYTFDEQGNEHTTDLIAQNNWFGDAEAFLSRQPAGLNIEAIEDSQVFMLS